MKTLIGEQIKKLREMCNVTQEQIAEHLGMSRQRFSRIEKGQSDISYETIHAIAGYLRINPSEITCVCEAPAVTNFRAGSAAIETFDQVEEMIGFFYANRSLYNRMNVETADEKMGH